MALKMMAVALTIFIVATTVSAVTPICNTAKDVALCTKMTNNAPTWEAATYNAINYELAVLKAKQSIAYSIGSKLPDDLEPAQKQDVIDTCNKLYSGMTEKLKKGLGLIKTDPRNDLLGLIQESYFAGCIEKIERISQIDAPADVAKLAAEIANNNDVLLHLAFNRPK